VKREWSIQLFIDEEMRKVREKVGDKKVLCW
jgi:GMP synthase PP-ATPase subunit